MQDMCLSFFFKSVSPLMGDEFFWGLVCGLAFGDTIFRGLNEEQKRTD